MAEKKGSQGVVHPYKWSYGLLITGRGPHLVSLPQTVVENPYIGDGHLTSDRGILCNRCIQPFYWLDEFIP